MDDDICNRPAIRILQILILFAAFFSFAGIASAGASGVPGTPVLSHDNWDNDGDYTVTMNMWWGNNGDTVLLYENGILAGEGVLSDNTPAAQTYSWKFSGKSGGDYEYYAVLSNDLGSTQGGSVTVEVAEEVSGASGVPGNPVLSHDNWDKDGDYTVTMNMWWGNNGDSVLLYENGILAGEGVLSDNTPSAQTYSWKFSGKPGGEYEYYAILSNEIGSTKGSSIKVSVTGESTPVPTATSTPVPTTATPTPTTVPAAVPGTPVLSHDNWDNDGDYTVTMNMWWGNNGDTVLLYENGILVGEGFLSDNTPAAQTYSWEFSGKSGGEYEYYAILSNEIGSTKGSVVKVSVTGEPTSIPTATPTPVPTTVPTETPVVTPSPTPTEVPTGTELSKRIVMYFPEWGIYSGHFYYYPEDAPWDKVTHMNYAFGIIKDGEFAIYDDWAATDHTFGVEAWNSEYKGVLGQFKKMKELYPETKQMISIGGWGNSDQFHFVAETDESRAKFADSVVEYIRLYGFDGVDIDWEYPSVYRPATGMYDNGCPYADGGERETFTLLLRDLRAALDKAGEEDGKYYELSAAIGVGKSVIDKTELDKYPQYLDFINLMTYDMHGAWDSVTGHISPLYTNPDAPYDEVMMEYGSTDAVVRFFVEVGVPSDKLVVGVPYYSRGWKEVLNDGPIEELPGLFATADGAPYDIGIEPGLLLWRSIEEFEEDNPSYVKYRDIVSGNMPYLYSEEEGVMLTYEDEVSIQEKADYIMSNDLGGVIIWEASGEAPGYTPLTDIFYNTFSTD